MRALVLLESYLFSLARPVVIFDTFRLHSMVLFLDLDGALEDEEGYGATKFEC